MKQYFIFDSLLLVFSILLTPVSFSQGAEKQPAATTINEFVKLPAAEQKKLLLNVFQQRLEHSQNLSYEVDLTTSVFYNKDEHLGELKEFTPFRKCQEWRLGNSYRMDSDMYRPNATTPSEWIIDGYNSEEGVSRSTFSNGASNFKSGRIDTIHDPIISDNHYIYWLSGEFPHKEMYLFQYLINHQDEFEIKAPVEDDKVQLTVSFQPYWANKPGGKRVFILDPAKGFLPIRGTSRWEEIPEGGRAKLWRIERFVVTESRPVDDVWMPIKLREEILASSAPETIAVHDLEVTRIEHGNVTPADLVVPFTEGMTIVDAIEGVTYVSNASGKPDGPVKAVMGGSLVENAVTTSGPGERSVSSAWLFIIAFNLVLLVCFIVVLFYRKHKSHTNIE